MTRKLNIGVITQPLPDTTGGHIILFKFLRIISPIAENIVVITAFFPGNIPLNEKITIKNIKFDENRENILLRMFKFFLFQMRSASSLLHYSEKIDMAIFHLGAMTLIFPVLLAKLIRKKIIIVATGSGVYSIRQVYKNTLFGSGGKALSLLSRVIETTNYCLADKIVVYSENIINEYHLTRFDNKITIAHEQFIDTDSFKQIKELENRKDIIGYIGRLSEEKGIMDFISAIDLILKTRNNVNFWIIGEGNLKEEVQKQVSLLNGVYGNKVSMYNWVVHEDLPSYLNELKLLIVPSYTEGLPNIILEAMACGTPVLATSVGAIPDLIKDEVTGFILENRTPICIVGNVEKILYHPKLKNIVNNAREVIEKEFIFDNAVDHYKKILRDI